MAYMRLGDLLVSSGVITNEQLEKALEMQKETKAVSYTHLDAADE